MLMAALLCALCALADDEATELNCEVEVNSQKITNGSREVFEELKEKVTDYMNTTKWKSIANSNLLSVRGTMQLD